MDVVRAFIAVDLSPEVQHELELVKDQLSKKLTGMPVRWVAVKNIHLTLKFLGDVPVPSLEKINAILQAVASQQAGFEISAAGLGVFPSISRPRVIWVGVQAPPSLADLQKKIEGETARLGYPSEQRKFSPHLTLGRIASQASPADARRIGEALANSSVGDLGTCMVGAVHLYRSDLQREGAIYTRLFSAALSLS